MMGVFLALLRGINVGKAKRIPMAELRGLLAELGHENARTLLNSGNVVFRSSKRSAAKLASGISAAIADRFGFDVPVVVKSARELARIVGENPIEVEEGQHASFCVAFVQDPKTLAELAPIGSLATPPDQFALGSEAAYLLCGGGLLESEAAKALLGPAGRGATNRNWATVLKLLALTEEVGSP